MSFFKIKFQCELIGFDPPLRHDLRIPRIEKRLIVLITKWIRPNWERLLESLAYMGQNHCLYQTIQLLIRVK